MSNLKKDSVSEPFDYLRETLTAPVYDVCIESPLTLAKNLNQNYQDEGIKIYMKREDLQPVFSFKIRGAYNKIRSLTKEQKDRGILAVSAGNHAQGVALASQKLGILSTIVMPLATPSIKWKNVQRLGSKVVLYGNDFDEAKTYANTLIKERQLTNIPPYDDPYIISGQGTVGVEILRQIPDLKDLEAIFCCVGGGGLAAGITTYVKRIQPNIKIFGVETKDSYAMWHALENGEPKALDQVGLFADGAAVRIVGDETFGLCSKGLDGLILVDNDDVCAAIKDIFEDTRSVVEPAGALGLAGLKKWLSILKTDPKFMYHITSSPQVIIPNNDNTPFHKFQNEDLLLSNKYLIEAKRHDYQPKKNYVSILSGANMDFDRLRFVADRADIGLKKEALISVVVPEEPGSFIKLHNLILPRNVTSFAYRYSNAKKGYIFMSFALLDPKNRESELKGLFADFVKEGFEKPTDLSDNELAKSHAKFLVGGRFEVPNERLFRFEFPERPDALSKFLSGLKFDWNVSLFHYRNYGGDTGKVLVGIQIPLNEDDAWLSFLKSLNYPWEEETNNPVYELFLKG